MLSDAALDRLRAAADWPDFSATRYDPIEVLGSGGMGVVYRARDTELDRDVAVKVLDLPEGRPEAVARLRREAAVLARLEHPGIVPVHDVGTLPDGRAFYVMKLVRGERLDAAAVRTRPLEERVRVARRVCDAVAFAHDRGVVHRDLKPSNVMIGAFGEVLVLDWGVARVRDAAAAADDPPPGARAGTAAGTVLGTPGYMAPEQARGEAARADERADVFGIGALLHDLVAGAPPRNGPALPRGTPRPLAAILRRCLAERPEDRYPAVTALAADLDAFLDRRPVAAHREGPLERAGRVLARHRTAALLILAYMVMRAAVILAYGF
jgi:serine/threonine protein kinase